MSVKAKPKAKGKSKSSGSSGSSAAAGAGTQAASEAFLRTNPERSTLADQLRTAREGRDAAIGASTTAANANVAAAKLSAPRFQQVYDDAAGRVTAAVDVPGVDNPTTGAGRDAAQTRGHLAQMLAMALDDTQRRQTQARAGGQFAVNQAEGAYQKSSDTISSRLRALAQEEGVYTSGRVAELTGDATKQAHDTAQQAADRKTRLLTSGVNPDGSIIKGGPKDPKVTGKTGAGGKKPATPDAVKQLRSGFALAKSAAADLKTVKFTRREATAKLTSGQKGSAGETTYETVKDPRTGKLTNRKRIDPKTKLPIKGGAVPEIPKIDDPLALSVALDIVYDGGVSRGNVQKLHDAGYDVKSLGVPTQTQRGKMPKPKRKSGPASPAERAPGGT